LSNAFEKFQSKHWATDYPRQKKFQVQSKNREPSVRRMKNPVILAILAAASSAAASSTNNLENFSPHLPGNTPIIWQVATGNLPQNFRVYQRLLPRRFSAVIISNAMVLASLQSKGFPQSSTNDFYIWEDKVADYPGPLASIFSIIPGDASIFHAIPNFTSGSEKDIPSDEEIVKRSKESAFQLGLNPAKLIQNRIYTFSSNTDSNGDETITRICGRGIFLSRKIDGFGFFSADNDGAGAEGFSIEFGSHGQIRAFSLCWPDLEPDAIQQTASPVQLMDCIRAHKIIVLPEENELNYFSRVKNLAKARKFTITKITPYYYDYQGVFGSLPTENKPARFIFPMAELEAVADFGTSNVTVRFISPILASEITKLLAN
jgi:hypothetical protein